VFFKEKICFPARWALVWCILVTVREGLHLIDLSDTAINRRKHFLHGFACIPESC